MTEPHDRSPRQVRAARPRTGKPAVDQAIVALIEAAGIAADRDLVADMIANAIRIGMDGNDRGDIKLLATAFRDLRKAENSFRPYTHRRKCSIFGSARTSPDEPGYAAARDIGAALAAHDWMVITGGGPGIMTAGVEGAGKDNSFGVTIRLPFESMEGGGIVPEARMVPFRHFFSRKLTFMKESSAYVVLPGGFGTLDESFELLTLIQTGKEPPAPVVFFEPPGDKYWETWRAFVEVELVASELVSPEDLSLAYITSSVDDAIEYINSFYSVFHSMRYVGDNLVIRLEREISDESLERLNVEFSDIVVAGSITRSGALPAEIDDDDQVDRPRLKFEFDHRHFGRLHQMVRSLSNA